MSWLFLGFPHLLATLRAFFDGVAHRVFDLRSYQMMLVAVLPVEFTITLLTGYNGLWMVMTLDLGGGEVHTILSFAGETLATFTRVMLDVLSVVPSVAIMAIV